MPKILTSPIARFPGTVVLKDPLTYPDLIAWSEAMSNARIAAEQSQRRAKDMEMPELASAGGASSDAALIPGILACVSEWHLDNFPAKPTAETWPATPRKSVIEMITWLSGGISDLMSEEETIPPA